MNAHTEAAAARSAEGGRHGVWSAELGLLVVLVVAFVLFAATAPNFLTTANQLNILRQAAFNGIIAMGMTLVILTAEIDISVGAQVALTSALIGIFSRDFGLPLPVILAAVVLLGVLIGTAAGAARAYLNVPSIIVTLALFLALRGTAEYITDASSIALDYPFLDEVLAGDIYGVPLPALLFILVFLAVWYLTTRTVVGRQIFAVGGNPHAARLAGLPVERIRVLVFTLTGALSALTGILLTARIGSGSSSIGSGLEFEVIAAVIVGGTRLTGGRGTAVGTLLGVLLITILGNALVLYGVNSYAQNIVRGVVVFLAVLISNVQSGRLKAKE